MQQNVFPLSLTPNTRKCNPPTHRQTEREKAVLFLVFSLSLSPPFFPAASPTRTRRIHTPQGVLWGVLFCVRVRVRVCFQHVHAPCGVLDAGGNTYHCVSAPPTTSSPNSFTVLCSVYILLCLGMQYMWSVAPPNSPCVSGGVLVPPVHAPTNL